MSTNNTKYSKDKKAESDKNYERIKQALENNKYKFRTIEGVSSEAHVTIETVEQAIREHSDEIVKLYRVGKNGESLITTRTHYKKKASIKEKLIGAVINSVY